LKSGRGPKFSDFQRQTICNCFTFVALIWSRGEYFVPPASPPYQRHSPFTAPCCAIALGTAGAEMHKPAKRSLRKIMSRNYTRQYVILLRREILWKLNLAIRSWAATSIVGAENAKWYLRTLLKPWLVISRRGCIAIRADRSTVIKRIHLELRESRRPANPASGVPADINPS
jgi:hypothetical protein